jgi:acid phosphatase (class A)
MRWFALPLIMLAASISAQMPDQTPTPVSAMPPLAAPTYVSPGDLDLAHTLPAWPQAGTLASDADVLTIIEVQASRTPELIADAQADSTTTMPDFTRTLLGADATLQRYPRLFAMMAALHQDMRRINRAANEAQGIRPRPILFDSRITPAIDMIGHGGASYPSARASSGHVWAGVIGQIFPDHAANAQAEAERIAWRRVVGGVHYPSDLAGSRHVAAAVLRALERSATFQRDLAEVRREIGQN